MTQSLWSPELEATVDQVFRSTDATGATVEVLDAREAVPPGRRVVERYRVWPSASRARYVYPADAPRAARAMLAGYGRLRSRRESVARAAVALSARGPLGGDELLVTVPDDAGTDGLLSRWLQDALGVPALRLGVPVRSLDPHSKPTVQLVSPDGSTVGFTKVGATPSAQERVAQEERGYALLAPASETSRVQVPAVLHAGDWSGRRTLTTVPVPRGARLVDGRSYDASLDALPLLGAGPWATADLAGSPTGQDLAARAARLVELGAPHARHLAAAADAVLDQDGGTVLVHGALHGDWVPWNLAVEGPTWWAWDLEHARASAPLGLDAVLGLAQQHVHAGAGRSIAAAVDATRARARDVLGRLGVGGHAADTVLRVGRLEVALRAAEVYDPARGWQTGMDDAGFVALVSALAADPSRSTAPRGRPTADEETPGG